MSASWHLIGLSRTLGAAPSGTRPAPSSLDREVRPVDDAARIATLVDRVADLAAEHELDAAALDAAAAQIARLSEQRSEDIARADARAAQLAELAAETDALQAYVKRLRRHLARGDIERRELLGQRDDARQLAIAMRDERDAEREMVRALNAQLQALCAAPLARDTARRPTGRIARGAERRALPSRRASDAGTGLTAAAR